MSSAHFQRFVKITGAVFSSPLVWSMEGGWPGEFDAVLQPEFLKQMNPDHNFAGGRTAFCLGVANGLFAGEIGGWRRAGSNAETGEQRKGR
jgi:hypothetical protein